MMKDHLDLTWSRASPGWRSATPVSFAYIGSTQILHMADMLSDGIIAQFPVSSPTEARLGSPHRVMGFELDAFTEEG